VGVGVSVGAGAGDGAGVGAGAGAGGGCGAGCGSAALVQAAMGSKRERSTLLVRHSLRKAFLSIATRPLRFKVFERHHSQMKYSCQSVALGTALSCGQHLTLGQVSQTHAVGLRTSSKCSL